MKNSLKEKLGLLKAQHVEEVIGDASFKFYPVSVGMLYKLQAVVKPLVKAFSAMSQREQNDCVQTVETVPMADGRISQVTQIGAVDPKLAELRHGQKQKAMEEMTEALLSDKTRDQVYLMLADSLRDDMRGMSLSDLHEVFGEMDLSVFTKFLIGFGKANARVFGPFAEQVREKMRALTGKVLETKSPEKSPLSSSESAASSPADAEEIQHLSPT